MTKDEICQQLQDKNEINEVLIRYCKAADLPDEVLLRTVFHPGATDDHAGMFTGNMEENIPKLIESRKSFNCVQHTLSNIDIKLNGDAADTECYVVGTMAYIKDGNQYHWLAGGRYVDHFERRNGEWRIAKRVTYIDWSRIEYVDPKMPPPF